MSSYSTGANGVTPNCQHCGRPVVGAAVYGNQGEPYHPACTQPATTQPLASREVFDIREARERIADLERQLADMLPVVEAARFHERSVTFYSHGTSSDIYHCDVCAAYKAYEARKPK